jgi:hypothetical protein
MHHTPHELLFSLLPVDKELESLTGMKAVRFSAGGSPGAFWGNFTWGTPAFYAAVLHDGAGFFRVLPIVPERIEEELAVIEAGDPERRLAQAVRSYIIRLCKEWR